MTNCPYCGKPVSGRARSCGYCGKSIVHGYFSQGGDSAAFAPDREPGAAAAAAMLLGICSAVSLFAALAMQLLVLYGFGSPALRPTLGPIWWARTLAIALPAGICLMQQLALRGRQTGLLSGFLWLAFSGCGLSLSLQAYLDEGTSLFYGMMALPYLMVLGYSLLLASAIVGILSYHAEA